MWTSLYRTSARKLGLHVRKIDPRSTRFLHIAPAPAQTRTPTGLYGFPHLKNAKGFQVFVEESIERSGELMNYISGVPSAKEIIEAMDEMSDIVCSVFDSAELCRQTHPDREFVEEANKASLRMNEYLHYLNTNSVLYEAVKIAEHESHTLSAEGQRAARFLRIDFERGGIHLCPEKLDRVNMLNFEISRLCREFNENIVNETGSIDIFPSSNIPRNLYRSLQARYQPVKGGGVRVPTDPQSVISILQLVPDDEVRKMAYIRGNSMPRANLVVLDKLIAARHELAEIMGYRSYAELTLKCNMASTAEVVMSFLLKMSAMVRPKADKEFDMISKFKRERCSKSCGIVKPWDEAYYTAIIKSSTYEVDFSVVASYFPLSQCIEGLKVLVESLFGATFHSIPMAPGESWHSDVLKLALHHPDEGDLGYLYLDLYSREGKYPGCAHFAIKGSRLISETEYQLPVVALVCNFPGSHNPSTVRLNHSEVETLFHEFGHAIHSLLSRTDYQHFSGTRVALELAETTSNLFEYYAWDYRVLKTFARHYSTGEEIPQKLVESLQGARKLFAATDLQHQIFYGLCDQKLFGEQPPISNTSSILAELKREHTCWEHIDGTNWQTRFTHFLNYGAGYYSYLYAKCFAATIWEKLCKDDPLSMTAGTALRTKLLQHGGAKDPEALLNGLVGDGIVGYHNGGIIPNIESLSREMNLGTSY